MRTNGVLQSNQIIEKIINEGINSKSEINMRPQELITKKELWHLFINTFKKLHGIELIQNTNSKHNLKALFLYFLQHEDFFSCENLRKDLSEPSFKKGILIIGGYGVGKTNFMKVFEEIFKNYRDLRFKYYSSKDVVLEYNHCQTPDDKSSYFFDLQRPVLYLDDINSENIASNYGKVEIIEEILMNRCELNLKTFASCNYTSEKNCASQTLLDLGERYGGRLFDRFHEMFNIIEFHGQSFRR